LPREDVRLACVIAGDRHQGHWYGDGTNVDATDITGIVQAVLDTFDVTQHVERVNCAVAGYNPFASAELRAGDAVIGHFGQLDPELAAHWDVGGPVFVMELSLTAVSQLPARRIRAHTLPRFPKTRRDLAVICSVEHGVSAAALQRYIAAQAGGALGPEVVERVWLFDRYTGAPLQADEVSLAFGIDYRSRARTLQESEVAEAFAGLQIGLQSKFGVQIRSA
jgi:phenylalanyl-tRNA synthetase beta chain